MSKSVENSFDTFWRFLTFFDVAPFRRPLLRSADHLATAEAQRLRLAISKRLWHGLGFFGSCEGHSFLPFDRKARPSDTKLLRKYFPEIRADFREGDEDSNFSVFRVRRFAESPGPLHWIAFPVEILTKPPIHWIASPLFTEKPFFSLKSASSHPLPKNWLWVMPASQTEANFRNFWWI